MERSHRESEILLVFEDASVAAPVEGRIAVLFASSPRIERDDPDRRERARRRAWMRYWPGVLGV